MKLERKPRGSGHIAKGTDFPIHSREVPMPGHFFESNPEDEDTTGRVTDTPFALSRKSLRFQIQIDKWPVTQ